MSSVQLFNPSRIVNQAWRFEEETGFLRCTIAANAVGVMRYLRSEFNAADIPADVAPGEDVLNLFLAADVLAVPESLASLEGKPAVVGHTWIDSTVREGHISCGQIAGAPTFDGRLVTVDLLVTDPETVRRITLPPGDPDRLEEISSAGTWLVAWIPGVTVDGVPYHGVFARVAYNHVALLPKGAGRAGATVRIINDKGASEMADQLTKIKLRNGMYAKVANEDVPAIEANDKQADEESKGAIDPAKLQEALDRLAEVNGQIQALSDERDTLAGQVKALQDDLAAALDPATIDAKASEQSEELDVANKVMNAAGCDATPLKGLRGHALRLAVVTAVRTKNQRPALGDAEVKSEPFVNGIFKQLVEGAVIAPAVPPLFAQQQVQNQGNGQQQTAAPASHFDRLYGKKK